MIFGIGTDIISLDRLEKTYNKFPNNLLERILTPYEVEIFNQKSNRNKINYLAKRFAAKEAVSKALATGIGSQLSFQDIEISNDPNGKPIAKVKGYENYDFHISISDEKAGYAIAFAIAEKH